MSHARQLANLAGLALAALPQTAASAGATASGTMTVSATVVPACSVEAGAMAFGTRESDRPEGSAQAALALQCTPGAAYSITLDDGQHGGRRMAAADGSAFLDYEIFQDPAGTRRWGGDAAGAVSGVAESGMVFLSAHGRIVSRSAAPGRYGDVVTVTVEF
jgi:spore coat protein U-like protein